jgi:3-methylcrotonyl-CoA carboxylase beta subunit
MSSVGGLADASRHGCMRRWARARLSTFPEFFTGLARRHGPCPRPVQALHAPNTLILNSSYGAGNYAMCGRAFDPFLTLAWPGSKCSVMGAAQAANALLQIDLAARERKGEKIDEEMRKQLLAAITASYNEQQDILYGAARGWLDRIIDPERTREELIAALRMAATVPCDADYRTGVLQT